VTDVRNLALTPLKELPPAGFSVKTLLSCQIYKHFEKRANDYLVYESIVKVVLNDPVQILGWCQLRMAFICAGEEHILILDGVDHHVGPEDRKWVSYVVPERDNDDAVDLGFWKKEDNQPVGVSFDEYTYRHPGSQPEDDEDVPHLAYGNPNYSPITTKASQHLRSIAFVGDEATNTFGRLIACYKNQLAVRIDNSRRCINYDCYEYKPKFGEARVRHEDAFYLPDPSKIRLYNETIKDPPMAGVKSIDDRQLVRHVCHTKALTADFCNSRCYRLRIPLDFVSGIKLLQDYRDPPIDPTGEVKFDGYDVAGVLILELSRTPTDTSFAVRTVAAHDNSFRLIGDWTPDAAASQAGRHYIYGAFPELKELAAHLCVVDSRIASLFENRGGSLQNDDISYDFARTLIGNPLQPLAKEDEPVKEAWNGDVTEIRECVKDRLKVISENGNHHDPLFIAGTLGL
jgi:hypothetical protein